MKVNPSFDHTAVNSPLSKLSIESKNFFYKVDQFGKGQLPLKNGKKDEIAHISIFPLPPCPIVTT